MELPAVAIPTYRRSKTISSQTLAFLESCAYPAHLITLFVADESEKLLYLSDVPSELYGQIVVGVLGLSQQRNFISDFYPEGQILLQLDDDVKGVKTLGGTGFLEVLGRGLRELNSGEGLWGVLPTDDARRFKDDTTKHLTHIVGALFLIRNHKRLRIRIGVGDIEDYERSIQMFELYGSVCRYRGAGVQTSFNKGSGGLLGPEREERRRRDLDTLCKMYPEACRPVIKGGYVDVILNWRYGGPPERSETEGAAADKTSSSLRSAPSPSQESPPCSYSSS
jgi:hypothetical protein